MIVDTGFEQGHPVMMRHPCGIVLNLLGPSSEAKDENVLMDIDRKYAGDTHVALRVDSLPDTETVLAEKGLAITGRFSFKDMNAMFIRDPDRDVIELDEHPSEDAASCLTAADDHCKAYKAHP